MVRKTSGDQFFLSQYVTCHNAILQCESLCAVHNAACVNMQAHAQCNARCIVALCNAQLSMDAIHHAARAAYQAEHTAHLKSDEQAITNRSTPPVI
jgi:hypothetical protein